MQKLTNNLQGDNWNELLKEVVTFDSVEEFWGVHVCVPSHSIPSCPSHHPKLS